MSPLSDQVYWRSGTLRVIHGRPSYLNGPRTLSNNQISYLILSSNDSIPTPLLNNGQPEGEFNLLICLVHYLGDGMAHHQFAHDFFALLASLSSVHNLETSSTTNGLSAGAPRLSRPTPNPFSDFFPMTHGWYNVTIAHDPWAMQRCTTLFIPHDPWVVQCCTTHGAWRMSYPWVMNNNCCTTHTPWIV
jgi:hypothetical protein